MKEAESAEPVTSCRQAAAVRGVTRFAVRAWIDRGQLPERLWAGSLHQLAPRLVEADYENSGVTKKLSFGGSPLWKQSQLRRRPASRSTVRSRSRELNAQLPLIQQKTLRCLGSNATCALRVSGVIRPRKQAAALVTIETSSSNFA